MQFNKVTWYSKTLAMILFIALPFAGFYLGMKYQEGAYPQINNVVNNTQKSNTKTVVNTDQVIVKTTYENGTLKYFGTVQVTTPCHEIKDETIVLESFPEQVQIYLTTTLDPLVKCAFVITDKEFSGEVQVSEDSTVSIFLNGQKVK